MKTVKCKRCAKRVTSVVVDDNGMVWGVHGNTMCRMDDLSQEVEKP